MMFLLAGVLFPAMPAFAEVAGEVVFVLGRAAIAGQTARNGQEVKVGDRLRTQEGSYLYVKTKDKGFLILRPNTEARIRAFSVDERTPANTRIRYELEQGVARVVSGEAAKAARQNFRMNTPVAAIGIRGTDFTVYTDDTVSRVSVLAGGVVVAPFSASCSPEGTGPCEGRSSLELYAGRADALIQVSRGDAAPRLIESGAGAPDTIAPPGKDEPAKAETGKTGELDTREPIDLGPTKNLESATRAADPGGPENPQLEPRPDIVWGRWQPVLDLPPEVVLAELQQSGYALTALNGYYAILKDRDAAWRPAQGSIGFVLQSAQAVVRQQGVPTLTPAAVENGRLQVNFGNSTFATNLDVSSGAERYSLHSTGTVLENGVLEGAGQFSRGANMNVRGVLGSTNEEAAYIFSSGVAPGKTVSGITHWRR